MPFELSLKNFVYIQVALFLFALAFLLWRPRKRSGLRMGMGKSSSSLSPKFSAAGSTGELESRPGASRNLQVFFNYNGHTFEAYESLGVPAGASMSTVDKVYFEQKNLSTPESRPFLEAAYQALKTALHPAKN